MRYGGAVVFDFIARAGRTPCRRAAPIREIIRLPDHDVRFEGAVDAARGTTTVPIGIASKHAPDRRSVEVHRQRWFSQAMIRRCLQASGLRMLCMRPVCGSDHYWLHVVARRM
jgi:hypothetical protein